MKLPEIGTWLVFKTKGDKPLYLFGQSGGDCIFADGDIFEMTDIEGWVEFDRKEYYESKMDNHN